MQNSKCKMLGIFLVALSLLFFTHEGFSLTCNINHSYIPVNIFYHGTTVSVKGEADRGENLVIKITSPEESTSFLKKEKVDGIFWMNKGKFEFKGINDVYMLFSTGELDKIVNERDRERYVLGYEAIKKKVEVIPLDNKDVLFKELIKLKEKDRLYRVSDGIIAITPLSDSKHSYSLFVKLPYQVPPDNYIITVYGIKDGRVVETAQGNMRVEQVGFVRSLSDMAINNGALYGVVSVVVALLAGFGIGMIFRKGG